MKKTKGRSGRMDVLGLLMALGIFVLSIYVLVWPVLIHSNLSEQTKLLQEIAENTKKKI